MPRHRIIALPVAIVALAMAPLACGESEGNASGDGEGSGGGGDGVEKTLGDADLKEPRSGRVELTLQIDSGGREGGSVEATLSGPFEQTGQVLPLADLAATVKGTVEGRPVDFKGGLTLLRKRGFLEYEGVAYEIPPLYFNNSKLSFLPSKPRAGGKGQIFAVDICRASAADRAAADFGDDLVEVGPAQVEGQPTTRYGGDVDVAAALEAIGDLAKEPACRAQLASAGVLLEEVEEAEDEVAAAAPKAHLEVQVGDDDVIRRVRGELTAEPKGGGFDGVEGEFELTLSEVDEPQRITPPSGAKPILAWFGRFGLSPLEGGAVATEPEGLGFVLELLAGDILPAGAG
jgi:hypothetical protein